MVPQLSAGSTDHAPRVVRVQSNDQSDFIMATQRHLQTLGLYTAGIDGVAGPGTWRAIREFYSIAGINKSDGILGTKNIAFCSAAERL